MVRRGACVLLVLAVVTACTRGDTRRGAAEDSVALDTAAVLASDTAIVQDRADWSAFAQALPRDPAAAARALESYRQRHGLPLEFFLRDDAPDTLKRTWRIEEDEMGCGTLLNAFVSRMPLGHPVLMTLRAIEFDSAGRTRRQWPLPGISGFYEIVAGVVGDELIASIPRMTEGVFLHIKPSGEYVVSAEPPPPLEREEWIEVADSVWLRVRPRGGGTMTRYASGLRPEPVGTWVPSGDSGWYVRTDSVPGQRSTARGVTLPGAPSPKMLACPETKTYEGMVCRGFPGVGGEHQIAYPMPCS